MRVGLLLIAGLFVAASFAGCTSKSVPIISTPDVTLVTKDATTGEDLFLKPNLTVGRWWEADVDVDFGGGFLQDIDGKIVVTEKGADGFRLGPEQELMGVFDAYFDSFYVGALDNDLNPTIQKTNVKLFEWPLKAGQTWTTKLPAQDFGTFNGRVDDMKMNVTTFEDDRGAYAPRLRIQGLSGHGERIDFDYSARTGWMTYFRMINSTTGQVVLSIDYKGTGVGYSGDVHDITLTPVYLGFKMPPPFAGTDPSTTIPTDHVTMPGGFSWVEEIIGLFTFPLAPSVGGGEVVAVITHPDGSVSKAATTGAGDVHPGTFQRNQVRTNTVGDWTVTILPAATGGGFVGLFGFKDDVKTF